MSKPTTRQTFKDYCLNNKYSKWYFSIVDKAINRNWSKKNATVYVERHHILPKSIIKNNDTVCLTAKEHFICHLLLVKMLEGKDRKRMLLALHRLIYGNEKIIKVKNSKLYENIKIKCLKAMSERSLEYWKNITQDEYQNRNEKIKKHNTGRVVKESTKRLISQKAKERLKDKNRHPLYGIGHSEATKKKISNYKKQNNPVLGKKWYYNISTKEQKYFIYGQQPEGFILGRRANV